MARHVRRSNYTKSLKWIFKKLILTSQANAFSSLTPTYQSVSATVSPIHTVRVPHVNLITAYFVTKCTKTWREEILSGRKRKAYEHEL